MNNTVSREMLETQLNDFRSEVRHAALDALLGEVDRGTIQFPEPGQALNLHCHTIYSYNGYGYSPTYFAWKARCEGLYAGGIIDFDVLDAVDEFLSSATRLGLRGTAGMETRVYVKPFETREINSPGEPGVAYHIGVGFVSGNVPDKALLGRFKQIARIRNLGVLERVNPYLAPAAIDYAHDVLPLTPNGNATERHLCMAYDNKAREVFSDVEARAGFWSEKLGVDLIKVKTALDSAPDLQGIIRSKTMKAGGVGYVKPSGPDFPELDRVNQFILESGAIPTFGWLDGTSEGEQAIEELLDVMMEGGVSAVNIIPDRNWNIKDPETRKRKVNKLHEFVELARSRDLPIVVGTEMNAYGNPFVDDFGASELAPFVSDFVAGARIVYAHTRLQALAGMGYLSPWAKRAFGSTREKNAFFAEVGKRLDPAKTGDALSITEDMSAGQVKALL